MNHSCRVLPWVLRLLLLAAPVVAAGGCSSIPALVINEFMADNESTLEAEDGSFPDWIEIYNAGDTDVSLDGIYVTDNLAAPTQSALPAGETLGAGEFLLVLADGDADPGHAVFKLERDGEEIGLYLDQGGEMVAIDSLIYEAQQEDWSSARTPDGGDEWEETDQPTPGASNG